MKILRIDNPSVSPCKHKLITDETFSMRYEYNGKIKYLFIPRNFIYDGASIPFYSGDYNPKYLRASLVHDYLCRLLNNAREFEIPFEYSVKEISELFGAILLEDGNNKIKSWIMEKAVLVYKTLF